MKAVYMHAESFSIIPWKRQTVDELGKVGVFSSIALDSKGYPHVSYCDATNRDLKYAKTVENGTTANSCIEQQFCARD